ncbi:hypothetical protein [Salinibacterium sp. NK8237]|uniref:hypothetical protein n=1 Tax=Salinibacterium sp. NK8237 TaxID=2792038 RepID=UPI0018CFCB0A|nr:hypothetical protein [Salinibacterium sp. NK8237]MBH0128780.1 hypothetical protein [Salinibacterium sp. NK8237]
MRGDPEYELTASPARIREISTSWRRLFFSFSGLALLAAASLIVFPPGAAATRPTLTAGAIVLLVLAALFLVRLLLIRRAAQRSHGANGAVIAITPTGIVVRGDTTVPFEEITGVFAKDDQDALLSKAAPRVRGVAGRALLRAGLHGIELTIGLRDAVAVRDTADTPKAAARIHQFAALADGTRPGMIQLPFGVTHDSAALANLLQALQARLEPAAPVKALTGVLDMAIVVGACADPATIIEKTRDL